LSYCPTSRRGILAASPFSRLGHMATPKRRSLGVLFAVLTGAFLAVTAYAALGGSWIIAACAGALGAWMAELSFRALR